MAKEMTCVSCPLGCLLTVVFEDGKALSVTGNSCKRGIAYAETEMTNPTRMLTTTVKVRGGVLPVLPVKSDKPVPKSRMFECMRVINAVVLDAPVHIGDVVIKDILGTGIDVIATNDMTSV
ncbi:MAG: DUF1667 domain-containing protein [Oscillospiraceae bacterium]|jgi:CxxC motif-containing protein|nr:DUF1667 domain-containing protein [Oscillospiraceae bacterium]